MFTVAEPNTLVTLTLIEDVYGEWSIKSLVWRWLSSMALLTTEMD